MNLPGCIVDLPTVTEKDEDDFVNFGVKYGVDMIALSFTRTAEDIRNTRDILGPLGSNIQVGNIFKYVIFLEKKNIYNTF